MAAKWSGVTLVSNYQKSYFLEINSKRLTNFKFTIYSCKLKWSSFSFNMLIKGFKIHLIKAANIKFLLPYNGSIFLIILWILNTYCVYSQQSSMYHILLVLIIPTQCCYASLFVSIDNTNIWACWNQLITCKSLILNI